MVFQALEAPLTSDRRLLPIYQRLLPYSADPDLLARAGVPLIGYESAGRDRAYWRR